jgi:RNA polymerase sigma-70 factor (ECF subfamily)
LRQGKSCVNLQGWIFKVAHNSALKQRSRRRRYAEQFSCRPVYSNGLADSSPGPEERMEATERRERLLAVVRALPERDQWCLSLRAAGLRYRDIAGVVGMSLGSVANALSRAVSRLTRAEEFDV